MTACERAGHLAKTMELLDEFPTKFFSCWWGRFNHQLNQSSLLKQSWHLKYCRWLWIDWDGSWIMTLNIYESLIHWLLWLLKHFLHFIIFMIIKTIIKVIASKNGGIFVFFSSVTLKKKTNEILKIRLNSLFAVWSIWSYGDLLWRRWWSYDDHMIIWSSDMFRS